MAKSGFSGPLVVYGQPPLVAGMVSDYNPDLAPSLFWGGIAILDNRRGYFPGGNDTDRSYGFASTGSYQTVNQVPSTISAVNLAAAQVPVAGTPLTLVAASGAGITINSSVTNIITQVVTTGLRVIDGVPGVVTFGSNAQFAMYDPTKAISRNVRITSVGNDSAASALVVGFDIYGQPMTESITLSNAGVASGKKAFKYVTSITPAGTLSGSNVSVGTGDVYGFPLRSDFWGDARIIWNNALITANTGYLAADTTSPATTTTGDVRGTYAVQSASDNTKRLQVYQDIPVGNLGTNTGMFGVTQV